jgi:hypothetical protein
MLVHLAAQNCRRTQAGLARRLQHRIQDDWSKLDGWPVVVLDADIRSDDPAHREAAREAWRELVGDMKPTVKTGGGGAHLCLRCPPDKLPLDQSIGTRTKIVSIEVGISGFLFNLSSWYLV